MLGKVKGKQAKMKGANNLKTCEIVGGFRGNSIAYRVAPRRGVFALKYFSRGDTVEICPVVTLARGDCHKKALYLSNRKGGAPMLLSGLGSLYSKGRANVPRTPLGTLCSLPARTSKPVRNCVEWRIIV